MWTAGRQNSSFRAQNNNSNFVLEPDNDLKEFGDDEDDDDDALGFGENEYMKQFSAGKGMAHQRSNDHIIDKKNALFGITPLAQP